MNLMSRTQYLYGIEAYQLKGKEYVEAIEYKIKKAEELLAELCDVDYMRRDNQRINEVLSAIEDNRQFLRERD